ncbi:enoyl-CoA hydratase/carnithine racemase [Candidatus Scalindua japonica]|uniref:Enoyl-CoA hydratase/carnithine racemase n=1 Tax=Candidatus Scalindua japonica TaxID=1284222 RepID=A0A286TWK5_9BACT|nr:enoyl-CoA hydratase/isomerase [Candidatus Scalindua japonica]GAX60245.1 enoyl-CoA hydratase/carnithine racemase [Candidatus Scalindua japonica]
MSYQTLKLKEQRLLLRVQLYRPEVQNSLNAILIEELYQVLQIVDQNNEIKIVLIEGLPDVFCTGMDFETITKSDENPGEDLTAQNTNLYYEILKCFSRSEKVIISMVRGKVSAGGIGLVAASDLVIADPTAEFGLSELLFGLVPACVLPFLIRRVGFQAAYRMALTTQSISASRAYEIGLVDDIHENLESQLRKYIIRLSRLESQSVKTLKRYVSQLWIIEAKTQNLAVGQITELLTDPQVRANIRAFVQDGIFPWESKSS